MLQPMLGDCDPEAEMFRNSWVTLTHSHASLGTAAMPDRERRERGGAYKPRASLHSTVTHLGPHDSCWLGALTPRGDDSSRSENIVHGEVVILKECFRYVDNLVKQKQVKKLTGIRPQLCWLHHWVEV